MTVEAHFPASNIEAGGVVRQGVDANRIIADAGQVFGRYDVISIIAVTQGHKGSLIFDLAVNTLKLARDLSVFGEDDAAGAPEAVGDFADEEFLEYAFGIEFLIEGIDKTVIFGLIFLEVG